MRPNDIIIEGKKIGLDNPVFLIAEAGINHNGDFKLAKKMIDLASEAKVDAIKFQTFKTEKLILKNVPKVDYQKETQNDKEDFFEMIKKYELTKEEFKELKKYSKQKKVIFLSTPFDIDSVELLEELEIGAYKIGSGDMNNLPLLELITSKKKPILLSTGMASLEEVIESIKFIKSKGLEDLIIFQCTTSYPAPYEELNLNVIDTFKKKFPNLLLGFSDHSLGIEASIMALTKGVRVIEKHFTLNKEMKGPDHKASLGPKELFKWVESIRNSEKAFGTGLKEPSNNEKRIAKIARKSLVSTKDLKSGDILTKDNIAIKRPGTGIPPKEYYNLLGKRVIRDFIPKDTIIRKEDIK